MSNSGKPRQPRSARRSRAHGERPHLTRLEGEVMRAVWDAEPEPVCARDVMGSLNKRAGRTRRPLAYTTVQTMLAILRDKGYLAVIDEPPEGENGRAHWFRARVSRASASRSVVGDVVDRLFGGRVQPLLQLLVQESRLDSEELEELRRWVEDRLRDRDAGEAGAHRKDPP